MALQLQEAMLAGGDILTDSQESEDSAMVTGGEDSGDNADTHASQVPLVTTALSLATHVLVLYRGFSCVTWFLLFIFLHLFYGLVLFKLPGSFEFIDIAFGTMYISFLLCL